MKLIRTLLSFTLALISVVGFFYAVHLAFAGPADAARLLVVEAGVASLLIYSLAGLVDSKHMAGGGCDADMIVAQLGCRTSVERKADWKQGVHTIHRYVLATKILPRPAVGSSKENLSCPRCDRALTVVVNSMKEVKRKISMQSAVSAAVMFGGWTAYYCVYITEWSAYNNKMFFGFGGGIVTLIVLGIRFQTLIANELDCAISFSDDDDHKWFNVKKRLQQDAI